MHRLFCSKCSSVKDVIPIAYGLPGVEMMEEGRSGKIRLVRGFLFSHIYPYIPA